MTARPRVLEVGWDPAVRFAGRMLLLAGCEVVSVRSAGVSRDDRFYDAGKELRAIGADTIRELSAWADLIVVGDADRDLVPAGSISRTVLSSHGAGMAVPASPMTIFAESGEASILGSGAADDAPPLHVEDALIEHDAGVIGALVSLAVLYEQHSHGGAPVRDLDVAARETEVSLNRHLASHFDRNGWIETRATQAQPIGGSMRSADGYVVVLPATDEQWRALVAAIGDPTWAADPSYETRAGRTDGGAVIQPYLVEWFEARTNAELLELALQHGIPIGPVRTVAELFECPQFISRGFFAAAGDDAMLPTLPWRSRWT